MSLGIVIGSLSICLFSSVPAFALTDETGTSMSGGTGLFLEPGVTYQTTNSNVDYGSGVGNSSASTRGFGAVVRGGIHVYERFFIAADGRYAMLKFADNASNYDVDATSWDVAPTVGMQMADWGARLYAGYVLAGNLDPKGVNNTNLEFQDATGWRFGAGLKVKHFSVNIEWQRLHYGKGEVARTGATNLTGVKYNAEGLLASVTFPIEFN